MILIVRESVNMRGIMPWSMLAKCLRSYYCGADALVMNFDVVLDEPKYSARMLAQAVVLHSDNLRPEE
jgi:hypothetical protein